MSAAGAKPDEARAGRASSSSTYVALSGGVGGAKLSLGLAHLLGSRLTIIVNTGDDFEHLGLHVSPDVDTTLYTLAGLVNEETGWGRRDETWSFMRAIEGLAGPSWFRLGDSDLATHVERTRRLRAGETPAQVCEHLRASLGVTAKVLPMSDDPVRTIVETDGGSLAFQEYFVREQCRPRVRTIRFAGAKEARAQGRALEALAATTLAGVIICPSNPYLSIDPILAVPSIAEALRTCASAGDRCHPDHRRQGRQGADREDHGRAWPSHGCLHDRAALFGADRRLRARSHGCAARTCDAGPDARHQHDDDDARRQARSRGGLHRHVRQASCPRRG